MPKEFGNRFSIEKIKSEREAFYAEKLQQLRTMNPQHEANKAIQSNTLYYMIIPAGRGSTLSIPGLVQNQTHTTQCKTHIVEGMGDVLYGKNHIKYRQEMLQYMQQFNALMHSYCG